MHVCSGDLWAGAEVAVAALLPALKLHYDVSALLFNEGIMAQRLRKEGIEVFVVQEKGSFRDVLMPFKMRQILKRSGTELVHTHGYKENVFGILAGRLAGVRGFVCTQHGASEPFGGSAGFRNDVNLLLDRSARKSVTHKTISVSEDLRRSLVRDYGSDRVVTIHNGIQCKEIPVKDRNNKKLELGIPLDKRVVGTMGRLKPVKDVHHFLKAARTIAETRIDVVFLVVGEGPLENVLRETARELRIDDRVYFLGFREDAIEILSTMDVFVLTSLHEGIPLSLLEAMCLGVPVVATKVGGIPEVIEDGCSGLLVELGDEQATATAILAMLSPEAKGIGREARRRVLQEFSLEQMAAKTEQVYRKLLSDE
jgi:glycosyltransferase involved in cell wall biosynthesis